MAFCVFLGLKNTPLSLLAVVSHAQLNILHRLVGYTAVLLVALHALFYTIHFGRLGRWETLIEPKNLWGIGAGLSMLILLMGIFRHMHYKLFYISHIAGFLFAAVMTGLHRPDWAKKLPVVMLFTLLLWILDRSIRTLRMSYNLVNNQVKLFPLPDGGTRLLLKKPCIKTAKPGSHCFLWIPRLRFYQAHPFTIVSNTSSGLELVIKSHKGFTRAVSEFAIRQPGRGAWVSVDGPYGSLPDTSKYDKIILISGGSGAAFTFGLMNHILDHSEGVSLQSTDFIWAVKRTGTPISKFCTQTCTHNSAEHLSWFHRHLRRYRKSGSQTRTTLYITDEDPATTSLKSIVSESSDCDEDLLETDDLLVPTNEIAELVDNVEYKKLDTDMAIQGAIRKVASHERVLVATCGPKSLMNAVRDSVDRCRMDSNNRIDVHCEDFSG